MNTLINFKIMYKMKGLSNELKGDGGRQQASSRDDIIKLSSKFIYVKKQTIAIKLRKENKVKASSYWIF